MDDLEQCCLLNDSLVIPSPEIIGFDSLQRKKTFKSGRLKTEGRGPVVLELTAW